MKTLSTFFLVLFTATIGYAQAPKKASKIIISSTDTGNSMLNKIALELFNRGYNIDMKDEAIKIITTKEHALKNGNLQVRIRAIVKDSSIVFSGEMSVPVELSLFGATSKPTFDQITNTGMKKSNMQIAWRELNDIAILFGEKIYYK